MSTLPPTRELIQAYRRSDATYDGIFFVAVRTTGIFCRPTCPARKPLPKNVEYFSTPRAALASGYRPCKRCKPLLNHEPPNWVTRLLEMVDRSPSSHLRERELRQNGIDPATARRYFLKHFGMTFQAYARARRLGQALHQIREGKTLDHVAFATGFDSTSGFRDAFTRTFGIPPGRSLDQDCITLMWIKSPLGPLVAGADRDGVCLLEFTDRRMLATQLESVRKYFKLPLVTGKTPHLEQLEQELEEYFAGTRQEFTVPLVYPGSDFQCRVWEELLRIPYGETRSYDDIAKAVGVPNACRAVGRTNGLNRIAIVIPCHRVVNKDGKLGGYGGGLRRKEFLLRLEQKHTTPVKLAGEKRREVAGSRQ
jgi:AraC family transcriptional regulator of adaptative response/methylated-DNA-[protein]-cysteine methyltransferase